MLHTDAQPQCDRCPGEGAGIQSRDVHGNGIPSSMEFPWEWEHKYNIMGMGMGRVHVTMGTASFSRVTKFPSVDSHW